MLVSKVGAVPIAIGLLVLVSAGPVTHSGADQQAVRYSFTAAVWDHQTFELSEYTDLLGRDLVVRQGQVYADKAPLQPLAAVPFYGFYRLAGGEPAEELVGPFGWFNVGLWWVTFWSVSVPAAVLAALMYRWAREVAPPSALWATLTMAFGSLLFVYSTLLFGHVPAALCIFAMFLLVRKKGASIKRLVIAGLVAGAAVLTEYPMALPVAVLLVVGLFIHRRRAGYVLLGGMPAIAALALYNWILFGRPLTMSYQWNAFSGVREGAGGTFDPFTTPTLEQVSSVLFGSRGLFVAAPVLLVAVLGFGWMWGNGKRIDVIASAGVVISLVVLQLVWSNPFAGGAGPRYITPSLPFLVGPLAVTWLRWRVATPVLAAISGLTMVTAAFTNPQLPSNFDAGLGYWLTLVRHGLVAENIFTLTMGSIGRPVHFALIGAAITALLMARRFSDELEVIPSRRIA